MIRERLITSALVCHKSNPDIHFVAYSFDKESNQYKCRHLSNIAESDKSIIDYRFYRNELEVVDMKPNYKRPSEFEVLCHRSNPHLKLIALEDLGDSNKTRCRWITADTLGSVSVHECIFENFELVAFGEQRS